MSVLLAVETKRALHRAGIAIPAHYVCIDIETTGLNFNKGAENNDLVVQVAWLECRDGKAVARFSQFCNWVLDGDAEDRERIKQDLLWRLADVRARMREKNETYQIRLEDLLQEPQPATETLQRYISDLLRFQEAKVPLCGLNILGFDLRVLSVVARDWLDWEIQFDATNVFDIGAMYKIAVGPVRREIAESAAEYLQRASRARIERGWNKRALIEQYGIVKDASELIPKLHRGDVDCELVHKIVETVREAECNESVRAWPGGGAQWDTQSVHRN